MKTCMQKINILTKHSKQGFENCNHIAKYINICARVYKYKYVYNNMCVCLYVCVCVCVCVSV